METYALLLLNTVQTKILTDTFTEKIESPASARVVKKSNKTAVNAMLESKKYPK